MAHFAEENKWAILKSVCIVWRGLSLWKPFLAIRSRLGSLLGSDSGPVLVFVSKLNFSLKSKSNNLPYFILNSDIRKIKKSSPIISTNILMARKKSRSNRSIIWNNFSKPLKWRLMDEVKRDFVRVLHFCHRLFGQGIPDSGRPQKSGTGPSWFLTAWFRSIEFWPNRWTVPILPGRSKWEHNLEWPNETFPELSEFLSKLFLNI